MKRLPELIDETKYFYPQQRNYELHRKKIESIMHKSSPVTDVKRQILLHKYYQQKDKSQRFTIRQKQQAVQKENDLIMRKIIKVSSRQNKTMERSHSEGNAGFKSHYLVNLKKESDQIAMENQRLADKIMRSKSSLYQKRMNDDYSKHLRRREMISKFEFDEDEGQVKPKKMKTLEKLNRQGTSTNELPQRATNNFSRITEQENEEY